MMPPTPAKSDEQRSGVMARTQAPVWLATPVFAWLAATGLLLVSSAAFRAAPSNVAPLAALQLSSTRSGESPAHRLTFDLQAGESEIYQARLTYPEEFRFRGFESLGPINTAVGAYEIDVDFDGTPDSTRVLRALGPDSAYVDLFEYDSFDPALEPLVTHTGGVTFTLVLPFGGDANADTRVAPVSARVSLVLFEGVIVNPSLGGGYTITAHLGSIDPDTGGPDDDTGLPPTTRTFELAVNIDGPSLEPFATLSIDTFDLQRHGAHRDRLVVHGRFVLGAQSDGLNLPEENITVRFDGFSQTLPGHAFSSTGNGYRFLNGRAPGIRHFWIWSNGRFHIDARDLHLIDPGATLIFALRIGNDIGEATVLRSDRER
jgi:hypothetical protein